MTRRFTRFLVVGGFGFLIDSGTTQLLIGLGASPYVARPPAIAVAMLFTWMANRQYTFSLESRPGTGELARYVLVAVTMALLNYGLYSLLVGMGVLPFLAIVAATAAQTVISFFAYQRFAFRSGEPQDPRR